MERGRESRNAGEERSPLQKMIMNFKHNNLQTKYGNSLREETKTRRLLHLLSQTASLITHDYSPLSALFISFSTMAEFTMELGKTSNLALVRDVGLKPWGKEAVDPGPLGLWAGSPACYYTQKVTLNFTIFSTEKAACQKGSLGALRDARWRIDVKPCVVREMWWEFRCLNSSYEKRNSPFLSDLWRAHIVFRKGVGKIHFKR